MTAPTFGQLSDPTQGGPGFSPETPAARLVTILAMIASGTNPDGTPIPGPIPSLAGPGRTATPGALTQTGGFTVDDVSSANGILLESGGGISIGNLSGSFGMNLVDSTDTGMGITANGGGTGDGGIAITVNGTGTAALDLISSGAGGIRLTSANAVIELITGVYGAGFVIADVLAHLPSPPSVSPSWGFTGDGNIYFYPSGGPWELFAAVGGPTDPAWTNATLINSWTGDAWTGFRKVDGRVYLRGSVQNGTRGMPAFVLPTGYRPTTPTLLQFPAVTNNGGTPQALGTIAVTSAGNVDVPATTTTFTAIWLDGISFDTL